jgi:peptidoglycan/xylan/chitin deacetylase (PgdA/CDA1 family)
MESRFGHDFSQVRVHSDSKAATSAQTVNAQAYTVGHNVVFGTGRYAPSTTKGRQIIAHELAHVVQQRLGDKSLREMASRGDSDEQQAERAANALVWGGMRTHYDTVAADTTWHLAKRSLPVLDGLSSARARIQRVELSYDDGPDSAGNTRAVLDALNAAAARATFYLVGKRVVQGDNWRVVLDIAAAGHWLGNHAYDWNDATDNHIFLRGTREERAQKILQTEWAIQDALIRGRDDAKKNKTWDTIPQANRDYIEDVIAHGTGRFRTPGFRSHVWTSEGITTRAAIDSVNQVLAASGLRPFAVTEVRSWGLTREGVTVDPEDWRSGRTKGDIESGVKGELSSNADTILLHSRIGASAAATPAILTDIRSRKFTFDPTAQGALGSVKPKAGFAGLSTISDPPTSAEVAAARAFLKKNMLSIGPVLAGGMAIGILQLAQRAGKAEVDSFISEIKNTTIRTPDGPIPMANWLNANEEWRLFAGFFENWVTNKPFPRIKGVTL